MCPDEPVHLGRDQRDMPAAIQTVAPKGAAALLAAKRLRRAIANWVNEGGAGGEVR